MNEFMKEAINEAYTGINNGHGGPFGCTIVKNGKIIGRGHNQVLKKNSPIWHGEMSAIEDACKTIGTFDLKGCEVYTTGEPCHMCLCALMWANVDKIYYGCTIKDNDEIGFRDDVFNDTFGGRDKLKDLLTMLDRDECLKLFEDYKNMPHGTY